MSYEPVELWTTGTIVTVTSIGRGGAPPEFANHQARAGAFGVAIVRLEHEGNAISLPGQLTEEAAVGETVVPVIRHIYTQ